MELMEDLARLVGKKDGVLVGRATTAIYLALKALNKKQGKVILPAIMCPSPANAVLYAGLTPLFCDVNLLNFTIDPASLRDLLNKNNDVVAVMAVHMFGHAADMKAILAAAKSKNIPVIENVSQALGGTDNHQPLGSSGDMTILSFGHTKIIDVGSGGAVLTDNENYLRIIKEEQSRLPEYDPQVTRQYDEYRKIYYELKAKAEKEKSANKLFLPLPQKYKSMYLFDLKKGDDQVIKKALAGLPGEIKKRRDYSKLYMEHLTHSDIQHPTIKNGDVPWRYTFLLKSDRQKYLTDSLRSQDIDVSNWYPSLHRWYESGQKQSLAQLGNSLYVESHIMNLWLDSSTDEKRIEKTCGVINELLEKDNTYVTN